MEILFKESSQIGYEECLDIMDAYKKILEEKKYPLLHVAQEYVIFNKDAREFSVTKEGVLYSKAEAYVINSLAHKILANFYMKVNQPPVPTKFFRDKDEAVEWLKEYL